MKVIIKTCIIKMHKNSFKNMKHKVKILTDFTHKSGPHWLLSLVIIY